MHVCPEYEVCACPLFTHTLNKTKQNNPYLFSGSMGFKIFSRIAVFVEVNLYWHIVEGAGKEEAG